MATDPQINPGLLGRLWRYYGEGMPSRAEFPSGLRGLTDWSMYSIRALPAGPRRLLRLQPVLAVATGLFGVLLMRSGFEYIPWVIALLMLAAAFIFLRIYLLGEHSDSSTAKITDFAVQYAIGDILLLILPFYIESTTFLSLNLVFAFFVLLLTVIASWDAMYEMCILHRPLLRTIYYGFTFFAVLNFVFPVLFGLRNVYSILLSAAIAQLIAILFCHPEKWLFSRKRNLAFVLIGVLVISASLWLGRGMIPPAPLKLVQPTACHAVDSREAKEPFTEIENGALQKAVFYTPIFAPLGLEEEIIHRWLHEGKEVVSINLGNIRGGREQGYRTWSRHQLREGPGRYTVEVWTGGGQLVGTGGFDLLENK